MYQGQKLVPGHPSKRRRGPICFMQFDSPWLDRLSILRRGNRLTVIGQITTVENYGVTLDPCLASQLGSLAMLLAIRLASSPK